MVSIMPHGNTSSRARVLLQPLVPRLQPTHGLLAELLEPVRACRGLLVMSVRLRDENDWRRFGFFQHWDLLWPMPPQCLHGLVGARCIQH